MADLEQVLSAALADALAAADVIDDKVCGCGFIGINEYDEYKEAQERIKKARAVLERCKSVEKEA